MGPRRAILISVGTAFGCVLAGSAVGGGLGVLAPGVFRSHFDVSAVSPSSAATVGLGAGSLAGFAAGSVVVVIGLVAALAPGLRNWRPFARGPLRPSLSGLALIVALMGAGFASLRMPSRGGAEWWFGLSALALAFATLAAIVGPANRRGFAAGFAVFGWGYLMLSLAPESREQLPSTRFLALLEKHISGEWKVGVHYLELDTQAFPARPVGLSWVPVATSRGGIPAQLAIDHVQPEFRRIGHALFTLLLAAIGGAIGDAVQGRGARRSA